jgi:hypothetical protein
MIPVIAHIRSLGIRIVIYLDDILILHQDPGILQSIFRKVVSLLEGLGFLINLNKCSQFPFQQLIFLGTMLNTVTMSLSLRTEKLDLIQQGELQPRTKGKTSLQELAALLGHMRHAAQKSEWHLAGSSALLLRVHSAGTLRYRGKGSKQSLELSREAMKDVEEPQSTNTQHLRCPPVDLVIHTDASLLGWGGGQQQATPPSGERSHSNISMHWSSKQHIFQSKISLSSISSNPRSPPAHIHQRIDNTTAVAHTNKRGAHSPSLSAIALELWSRVLKIRYWVTATHIPGILNVHADTASRQSNPRVEWTLDPRYFGRNRFHLPEVGLFASKLTHQVESYVSRFPDPGEIAVDAFVQIGAGGRVSYTLL